MTSKRWGFRHSFKKVQRKPMIRYSRNFHCFHLNMFPKGQSLSYHNIISSYHWLASWKCTPRAQSIDNVLFGFYKSRPRRQVSSIYKTQRNLKHESVRWTGDLDSFQSNRSRRRMGSLTVPCVFVTDKRPTNGTLKRSRKASFTSFTSFINSAKQST